MKGFPVHSLFLGLAVAFAGAGCVSEPSGVEEGVDLPRDEALAAPSVEEAPAALATLRTPSGSEVRFLPVDVGEEHSVLVVESGEPGTLVLEQLTELADGVELGARDIWRALAEPGVELPTALDGRGREPRLDFEQGWARSIMKNTTQSLVNFACDNTSFVASTPDGLLADVFTRLDTNDEQDPSLWANDCYQAGSTCYFDNRQYAATWTGINKWRGKACGFPFNKVGEETHTVTIRGTSYTILPKVSFLYKTAAETWEEAHLGGGDSYAFPLNTTTEHAWYWNGATGSTLDWRLSIRQAKAWDQFDVLMSKP